MKRILAAFYAKPLSICLVAALIVISTMAGPAEAMFLPSSPQAAVTPLFGRAADLARIQNALESRTIQQRLLDYGLSPEKTMAKLNSLSDEQVHQLAVHIDAVQAGGHRGLGLEEILIILLLVLLILLLVQNDATVRTS
jgi:Family of unknown function (DUF6627)